VIVNLFFQTKENGKKPNKEFSKVMEAAEDVAKMGKFWSDNTLL
jgi:hypothetical protein